MTWSVPAGEWAGQRAFVLGGGESLAAFDVTRLRGQGRVIAVNDAGLYLAPGADILFFADGEERWFGWNRDKLHLFKGPRIVSRARVRETPRLHMLRHDPHAALSHDPRRLAGFCGGSSAINLAFLLGASEVVLLGFDMRGGNWHANHRQPNVRPDYFRAAFIPALERMAPELAAAGCRVLNATPGSALRCFPMVDLEEIPDGRSVQGRSGEIRPDLGAPGIPPV